MNEFKDQEWEEYWLPKIEAECYEYKLQKRRDRELVWDFLYAHFAVLFFIMTISIFSFLIFFMFSKYDPKPTKNFNSHTENVPYTYRNID